MNKMLVATFDSETAAEAGLQALHRLHATGDITVYATGVLSRDAQGLISVKRSIGQGPIGTATGLAVGSLIGLLGGPVGVAVGALTGSMAGAVRDFWMAGVGLDFIEAAEQHLLPGKTALVAEIEEEWIVPVDNALEAVGGQVLRRSRAELADSHLDQDIAAVKAEIKSLEAEVARTSGAAQARLNERLAAAQVSLTKALDSARQRVEALTQEAEAKAEALQAQLAQAQGEARIRLEDRVRQMRGSYHARGAKLAQAWGLAMEAFRG